MYNDFNKQVQLESMGNPFTRDGKKALQKRREAEILQMKQNLDEQIEERKKGCCRP